MEKLPTRLLAITQYIDCNDHVADIGSDHGLLPLFLAEQNQAYIYASDNKKGPYERLKKELSKSAKPVNVALSDGLFELPTNIDTLVIAGMGGELIASILSNGQEHLDHIKKLILVPHGQEQELRQVISYLGFSIQDEQVIEEDGKFYELIYALNQPCFVCGIESMFGPVNIRKKTPAFLRKWQFEHDKIAKILEGDLPLSRREELLDLKKRIYDVITTKGDLQND